MKKEKIITILKQYINTQLDTINTPIISFFKPVIKRIVDNNINKVNSSVYNINIPIKNLAVI